MWLNPQETEDLVTFTEKGLNGKLHFSAVILHITYDKLQIDIRHTAILTFSKNDAWMIFVQIKFQAENECKQEYFPFIINQESREKSRGL